MAASVQQVDVASREELEGTIASYIAQGFVVRSRTASSVTLFKKKEFNVIWAVIGFFLCLLPLIVYCIVYATQSDEMVIVQLRASGGAAGSIADELIWSEDREWWWDGQQWRDALRELPPGAVLSEDRRTWWDGKAWREAPVETSATEAPPGAESDDAGQREMPSAPPQTQTSRRPADESGS
ncbi:MAG TPA: hypothetical protein VG188_06225 [Solirubrobacteraceae bacterium]|jgi:hypothetical protein|nr:hypothetical protein [Solirubrobacteraceae bacterium]